MSARPTPRWLPRLRGDIRRQAPRPALNYRLWLDSLEEREVPAAMMVFTGMVPVQASAAAADFSGITTNITTAARLSALGAATTTGGGGIRITIGPVQVPSTAPNTTTDFNTGITTNVTTEARMNVVAADMGLGNASAISGSGVPRMTINPTPAVTTNLVAATGSSSAEASGGVDATTKPTTDPNGAGTVSATGSDTVTMTTTTTNNGGGTSSGSTCHGSSGQHPHWHHACRMGALWHLARRGC